MSLFLTARCVPSGGATRALSKALVASLAVLLAWLGPVATVEAQGFTSARVVKASPFLSLDRVPAGSIARVAVVMDITAGWHVNAHVPSFDYLIPTKLAITAAPPDGITFSDATYPAPIEKPFAFSGGKSLRVYEGRVVIVVNVSVAADQPVGQRILKGTLTTQACSDDSCLAPARIPIEIPLPVVAPGEQAQPTHSDIFNDAGLAPPSHSAAPSTISESGQATPAGQEGTVGEWVAQRGWGVTLLFIFLGGLALNLTPCVYPLIPITLAYFGGQAGGRPSRTFTLAGLYVLGMCATYSALGAGAAMTGSFLGSALQSPIALVFVALVMCALGLSMLGLFEIQVPLALRSRIGSRPGAGGALFMGLTVGLVAAPCVGPFVVSLLVFVGQSGSPALGFLLFFVLSLGLGLPYLLLGGFAGAATGLPKAGAWMVWVKKVFGCILFAMAFYFVNPLLPKALAGYTIPAMMSFAALYLGFMERSPIRTRGFRVARLTTAAACAGVAALLLIPSQASAGVAWTPYTEEGLARAISAGRPIVIDFTAEWCLPCKEMDRFTFGDPNVVRAAGRFTALKVDITSETSDEARRLQEKYEIMGAPTILFIDSAGSERRDLRLTGFEGAKRFLDRLNGVQ